MKNILRLLLLFSLHTNSQTIEKNYSDFDLVTNVKSVTEIKPYLTKVDLFKDFDNVEDFFNNAEVKKIISDKFNFNDKGFISQHEEYYSGDNKTVKENYLYDSNKLLEIIAVEKEGDGLDLPYYNTKIVRNENIVTKTTTYAKEDTIYKEKFIVENGLIMEQRRHDSNSIWEKYTYNDKNHRITGELSLQSGEKLIWSNEFEYFLDGTIKSKTCIMTDLKSKKIEEFYPNGLIKKTVWNDEIRNYEYKYDKKGNWIYKIEYKNGKPKNVFKRVIVYN